MALTGPEVAACAFAAGSQEPAHTKDLGGHGEAATVTSTGPATRLRC
jgi:hypothetical protein